ncbi:MAG: sensor domain-containing diguanylate cyclase [Candidatus Hydrogenedentes bacterium]|nr:sensor domain-containing diguanylate cyclase [Candidatus Hydrogenedentota bacterium]
MSDSLVQTALNGGQAGTHPAHSLLVPLHDPAVYYLLVNDAAENMLRESEAGLLVAVDSETAEFLESGSDLPSVAERIWVFGARPEAWQDASNVTGDVASERVGEHDRFFLALSPERSTAFLAVADRRTGFRGGWTSQPTYVREIAKGLLEGAAAAPSELPALSYEAIDKALCYTNHLMTLHAGQFPAEQDDVAVDKHDLMSVLEILKAISAKRRSHDVLFVFVEKIAQVVEMSRCSVVRIWGGENVAHVLASHDNERIRDLRIDLAKYPEVRRAVDTLSRVIIKDVFHDPLTRQFSEDLRNTDIRSVMVIPIVLLDPNVGSLFLRAARGARPFTQREVSFCEIVAEAASNALERAHLFESIQRANERLEFLAITDGLTGLFNHRHFRERLDEEFERARRYNLPLSCMIFDIDDFKQLNDTYGHLVGDQVLQEMAARTMKIIRRSDMAARYGGEEFTIIMPQTGREGAEVQAHRLLEELCRSPYKGLPADVRVTVSMGVAVLEHEAMLDCEALIRVADSALYQAKRNGKNQVVVGTAEGSGE